MCLYHSFLSLNKPKKVEETLKNTDWVTAIQEELNEFERNKVWTLVPRPKIISIVGTNGCSITKLIVMTLLQEIKLK